MKIDFNDFMIGFAIGVLLMAGINLYHGHAESEGNNCYGSFMKAIFFASMFQNNTIDPDAQDVKNYIAAYCVYMRAETNNFTQPLTTAQSQAYIDANPAPVGLQALIK